MLTIVAVGVVLIGLATSTNDARQRRITVPRPLPAESYSHPPEASFDRSDYVIKVNQMSSFYDKPGAEPVNVVAAFPSRRRDYTEVGPNPLVKRQ